MLSYTSPYAEIMKLYFSGKMDVDGFNYEMMAKHALWPFTILDFERAGLGALQGATTMTKDVAGGSTASKAISGALGGAAMTATFSSNPATIAACAFLGLACSLF